MVGVAALMIAALVAGCQGGDDDRDDGGNVAGGPSHSYVALGDSAVAGAGIGPGEGPCFRSSRNYPSLLAQSLKLADDQFVDVSCPGATTKDVLDGRQKPTPLDPQVDAIGPDTDLVTISIGGNDSGYIPALFTYCYLPPTRSDAACQKTLDALPQLLPGIKQAIAKTLTEIAERAPKAQVVLVSYLRLTPDNGACAASTVPGPAAQLRAGARAEGQLEKAMREAADEADVSYVSMRDASADHSACATDDPWASGITAAAGDGSSLHPNAAGMQAVADKVLSSINIDATN